jgi:plastocyanin domain-containing protein
MVLVSRLQVIVEKKIKPPIEVQRLVTTNGLSLAMLSGYDAALLMILGCLWND